MPKEAMDATLQYGALGILAVVIFYGLRMIQNASERSNKAIDSLTSSVTKMMDAHAGQLNRAVDALTVQLEKIETIAHEAIASQDRRYAEAQRNLDRFENAMTKIADSHKNLERDVEKYHAFVLAKIEESAMTTRHQIGNALQLLVLQKPVREST